MVCVCVCVCPTICPSVKQETHPIDKVKWAHLSTFTAPNSGPCPPAMGSAVEAISYMYIVGIFLR